MNNQAPESKQSRLQVGSIGIVTTLVYLWLAVLGAGGFAAFFSHSARTILAVASLVMASAAFFSDVNLSSGEREDRSNRWIFLPLLVIGLLSAFLPAYAERQGWWVLDGETVRWLGVFFYLAGGALRIWPIFVLGRRFSGLVAIQPGHELVTDGVGVTSVHPGGIRTRIADPSGQHSAPNPAWASTAAARASPARANAAARPSPPVANT